MAESTTEDSQRAEEAGIFGHFSGLLAAQLGYLRARLRLAGIEGKEAAVHGGIILGLAIGALIALIFGYFLFVLALVFLVALAFGGGNAWIWVLLSAAALHFVGAGVLLLIARAKLGTPLFPLTLGEFQKDQEWLKTTTKPN
jgi:uncharacterized membrane protein YqjE